MRPIIADSILSRCVDALGKDQATPSKEFPNCDFVRNTSS
jgi:hypothetical protein